MITISSIGILAIFCILQQGSVTSAPKTTVLLWHETWVWWNTSYHSPTMMLVTKHYKQLICSDIQNSNSQVVYKVHTVKMIYNETNPYWTTLNFK